MTGNEQALFALMQDMGYSHGLCVYRPPDFVAVKAGGQRHDGLYL